MAQQSAKQSQIQVSRRKLKGKISGKSEKVSKNNTINLCVLHDPKLR